MIYLLGDTSIYTFLFTLFHFLFHNNLWKDLLRCVTWESYAFSYPLHLITTFSQDYLLQKVSVSFTSHSPLAVAIPPSAPSIYLWKVALSSTGNQGAFTPLALGQVFSNPFVVFGYLPLSSYLYK